MFEKGIGIHVALRLKKLFHFSLLISPFFIFHFPLLRSPFALGSLFLSELKRLYNGFGTEVERRLSEG